MLPAYQDAIGQFPILKTYNHGTLGFKIDHDDQRATIIRALQSATAKLIASFPWLAGAVVNEGSGPGNSGVFKLVDWPKNSSSANLILRVRDYTESLSSFVDLLSHKAPCSMIDGKLVASYPGFPESYDDSADKPAPILAIQANFIKGGLLLNFSTQHNAIDASGMMQVIKLFSVAMQGVDFSSTAIQEGNRDRNTVIPLIPSGETIRDHSHLQIPPNFAPSPPSILDGVPRWGYFLMSSSSVPKIKAAALQFQESDQPVPFISSNDALSAFYWKCIADVRTQNGQSPQIISKFLRAIDARKAMGVSYEYMGHMVYHAATRMTFEELQKEPISAIACRLRSDLNDVNNGFSVRSYATYIANTPNKSRILYGGLFNRDTDVGASAVANADFFHSFGVIGKPMFARRPYLAPIPGCVYFMPSEGPVLPVLVCLRDDEMDGLKNHPEWSKVTEFIG
ncbi:unnamed protein product [Penicillium salamii]|uniref:Trichothecene 3-O-acetyltransferase-like N-terminal domain-containing protein n=1 Tax=Penicillium salamii TaxID=1612424 RepID=A0A9W4NHK3_9EURO|nr:unnamed protein product [Penicillium salamii]CAG7989639.1 unnamed protein product [Penicillium salamii]CAG8274353.1 unnamed protein product [Penicillium salamii]CAG8353766.1 unnamed protein product [Penicillium salamii]CAG8357350.1 unnamed protein product [Penicillium salamii]